MNWEVGVTTVPSRFESYLPDTLQSLKAGGFPDPRLFVDCAEDCGRYVDHIFGLPVTYRVPKIGAYGNWLLGMWEIYLRNPVADRYVIFQDDVRTYKNLRQYLDSLRIPDKGYWNLYTYPMKPPNSLPSTRGWYVSPLLGKGALGLVFDMNGILALLSERHTSLRVMNYDADRRTKSVDGAVYEAMKNQGYTEYLHGPSLLFHVGKVSSCHEPSRGLHYPDAEFKGESFDALEMM
jgi:hypothetical protein